MIHTRSTIHSLSRYNRQSLKLADKLAFHRKSNLKTAKQRSPIKRQLLNSSQQRSIQQSPAVSSSALSHFARLVIESDLYLLIKSERTRSLCRKQPFRSGKFCWDFHWTPAVMDRLGELHFAANWSKQIANSETVDWEESENQCKSVRIAWKWIIWMCRCD